MLKRCLRRSIPCLVLLLNLFLYFPVSASAGRASASFEGRQSPVRALYLIEREGCINEPIIFTSGDLPFCSYTFNQTKRYKIDWGDGSAPDYYTYENVTNPSFTLSHRFGTAGVFKVIVGVLGTKNGDCPTREFKVTVHLAQPPVVTVPAVCPGTPALLTVQEPQGTYRWYDQANGGNPLFTGESFLSPALSADRTFFVEAVNSYGCVSRRTRVKVALTKISVPSLSGTTICAGERASLLATGKGLTFEWYTAKTGGDLVHRGQAFTTPVLATSITYFVSAVPSDCAPAHPAERIRVDVLVKEKITGNRIVGEQETCAGVAPAPLTSALTNNGPVGLISGGTGSYLYRWESSLDNQTYTPAAGTTNQLDYHPGILSRTTWFRRVVVSGECTDTSEPVKITVKNQINNNVILASRTVCSGVVPAALAGSVPTGGNGSFTYQWETSTTGPTGGFVAASGSSDGMHYTPPVLERSTWVRRVVTSAGCSVSSEPALLSVVPPISNNFLPAAFESCSGAGLTATSSILPRCWLKTPGSGGR
jgi:hypothetical protein